MGMEYFIKMEPKFEFVGTTNSTLYNVKNQTKNNRVFHIKKIYPDGRETYCEYTTNRVNVNSICLRCTNRKCKGTLILETSQPTHVARRQVLASGKERNIKTPERNNTQFRVRTLEKI